MFPFGTLGESADIMEQAQAGILQFVSQSPGFTGALIPEAQVFFVPYLMPQDESTLQEFFTNSVAINEMFPEFYAEQGLELMTMYPEGEACMTTQEPVRSPSDLDGVKFRVMTNPLLVGSYGTSARHQRRCRGARSMVLCRQASFRVRITRVSSSTRRRCMKPPT